MLLSLISDEVLFLTSHLMNVPHRWHDDLSTASTHNGRFIRDEAGDLVTDAPLDKKVLYNTGQI